MLLYLRSENEYRIDTIELLEGCFPNIIIATGSLSGSDDQSPPKEEYSVTKLEPAVWGILLLVERIYVDCGRRRFCWTTSAVSDNDEEEFEDPSYGTEYCEDECYDYNDDVDELFNLAHQLIQMNKSRTKISKKTPDYLNRIKEEQYSLIRMLYCYILPKVQIFQKDLSKVNAAIKDQTNWIQKIDEAIERHSQMLDEINQMLQRQQDDRLDKLGEIAENKKCTKTFLKLLEKDLKKRKNQLNEKLDEKQTVVAAIKSDIAKHGETFERKRKLGEARRESANYNCTLQRLLIVHGDTIKTALLDNDFLDEDTEQIVLDYLRTTELSMTQKRAAKNQTDKKARATSILENLKCIKEKIESAGVAISVAGGLDITGDHFPEYETLSKRVSSIVQNPEHPLGEEFQKFLTTIQEQCQDILNDVGDQKGRRPSPRESGYIVINDDCSLQEEYSLPLENLCRDIRKHFDVMATNFLEHFSSCSSVLRNKLQLCYEENFYETVGEKIAEVYNRAYQQHKLKMIDDIQRLTMFPIDCLDLGMKNEWWLELFEKRRKVSASYRHSSLEKMSLNNLESSKSPDSQTSSSSSVSLSSSLDSTSKKQLSRKKERRKIRSFVNLLRKVSTEIVTSPLESSKPESSDVPNNTDDISCGSNDDTFSNGMQPELYCGKSEATNEHSNGIDNAECLVNTLQIPEYQKEVTMFEEYFGPSLECLRDVFKARSVFAKLKCLSQSLRKVTHAVQELRRQVLEKLPDDENMGVSTAITGDDILPLIVLMILQMDYNDAAALQGELKMLQDLIPNFLSAGCHGWAMMEFEMACRVLQSLCAQFDWNESLGSI